MTWLYVVVAGAAVARWGLWRLRDVIEWLQGSRRDHAPPTLLARLRLKGGPGTHPVARMPVLRLSREVSGGPRGA